MVKKTIANHLSNLKGAFKTAFSSKESSCNPEQAPASESPESSTNAGKGKSSSPDSLKKFGEWIKEGFRAKTSKNKDKSNDQTTKKKGFQQFIYDKLQKFKKSKKPKHQPLTAEEEAIAIGITNESFNVMTSFLAPTLREFLDSRGLIKRRSTIDCYLYLKTLIKAYKNNKNLFTPNIGASQKQLLKDAMEGRNAICHGDLHDILTKWEVFLKAWIDVSILIGNSTAAGEIEKVLTHLQAKMNNPPKEAEEDDQ